VSFIAEVASAAGSEKIPDWVQPGIYIGSFYNKRCPCNVKPTGPTYNLELPVAILMPISSVVRT
jgi:hypothetical protein